LGQGKAKKAAIVRASQPKTKKPWKQNCES